MAIDVGFLAGLGRAGRIAQMRIALLILLISTIALADTITTKGGQVHNGKVVRELERGYLFRDETGATTVLPFAEIDDVSIAPAVNLVPIAKPPLGFELRVLQSHAAVLRMDLESVSIVWPIVMMSLGGAISGFGLVRQSDNATGLYLGLGAATVGLGGILLGARLFQRSSIRAQIAEIELEIVSQGGAR